MSILRGLPPPEASKLDVRSIPGPEGVLRDQHAAPRVDDAVALGVEVETFGDGDVAQVVGVELEVRLAAVEAIQLGGVHAELHVHRQAQEEFEIVQLVGVALPRLDQSIARDVLVLARLVDLHVAQPAGRGAQTLVALADDGQVGQVLFGVADDVELTNDLEVVVGHLDRQRATEAVRRPEPRRRRCAPPGSTAPARYGARRPAQTAAGVKLKPKSNSDFQPSEVEMERNKLAPRLVTICPAGAECPRPSRPPASTLAFAPPRTRVRDPCRPTAPWAAGESGSAPGSSPGPRGRAAPWRANTRGLFSAAISRHVLRGTTPRSRTAPERTRERRLSGGGRMLNSAGRARISRRRVSTIAATSWSASAA